LITSFDLQIGNTRHLVMWSRKFTTVEINISQRHTELLFRLQVHQLS